MRDVPDLDGNVAKLYVTYRYRPPMCQVSTEISPTFVAYRYPPAFDVSCLDGNLAKFDSLPLPAFDISGLYRNLINFYSPPLPDFDITRTVYTPKSINPLDQPSVVYLVSASTKVPDIFELDNFSANKNILMGSEGPDNFY